MKTTRINPVSRRAEPFVPAWSRFGRTVFAGEELASFSLSSLVHFSSVQLLNNFVNFHFISGSFVIFLMVCVIASVFAVILFRMALMVVLQK